MQFLSIAHGFPVDVELWASVSDLQTLLLQILVLQPFPSSRKVVMLEKQTSGIQPLAKRQSSPKLPRQRPALLCQRTKLCSRLSDGMSL